MSLIIGIDPGTAGAAGAAGAAGGGRSGGRRVCLRVAHMDVWTARVACVSLCLVRI